MRLTHPLGPGEWRVSQRFGENPAYYQPLGYAGHEGVDFACSVGTPVYAAHDGLAVHMPYSTGYGRYLRIENAEMQTTYAHLSAYSVKDNTFVRAGEQVALSGATGNVTGPHLHFGVRPKPFAWDNGYKGFVNPEPYLEGGEMITTWHVQSILPWMDGLSRQWGAPWIKVVNPPEDSGDPFPGVQYKLARFWHDDTQGGYIAGGRAGGRQWVRDFLPRMRKCSWATAFETANEPGCNSPQNLANLREYSLGAMEEASANGVRLCILNLSEGNPAADEGLTGESARNSERWKLQQLAPAVIRAVDMGHYVGLHGYWLPPAGYGPLDRWHSLGRIVWDVEQWAGMGVDTNRLRVLLNETGVDGLIENRFPYKSWRSLVGLPQYASQVAQLEREARKHPWLKAAMLFTVGYLGEWGDYDHRESDLRVILAELKALGAAMTDEELGAAMQAHVIPLNPDTAIAKSAAARGLGLVPASDEVRFGDEISQVWRSANDLSVQHIARVKVGDWGNVRWFTRKN